MADVFGRADSPFAGAFSSDASFLRLPGAPGTAGPTGANNLVQGLNVQYQQPVSTLFEIGSNFRYYVVGRASGQMGLDQILGPTRLLDGVIQRLGNPCIAGDRSVELVLGGSACTGAGVGQNVGVRADACVATAIGYGINAQDLLLRQNTSVIFGQLRRL